MSFVAVAVLILCFIVLADLIGKGTFAALDRRMVRAMREPPDRREPIGPAWLQSAARDVTALGSIVVIALLTCIVAGYFFFTSRFGTGCLMTMAVFGGLALNSALKRGYARRRPDFVSHAVEVLTPSFPSGHAALSSTAYLTLGALLDQSYSSLPMNIYFTSAALFLTLIIGISRVYLGVHYPTDVVGGWLLGGSWAIVCRDIMAWLQEAGHLEPPSIV
jgi:undecaprenyl-diphosphatase